MTAHPSNRWTGVAGMKYKTLCALRCYSKSGRGIRLDRTALTSLHSSSLWYQVDQHFGISIATSSFQDNTDLNEHSWKSISCLSGSFEFWGISISGKHHCVHFLLLLLFCKHSFHLKAKSLIPEHSAYATVLNKKDQLVFISYHAGSTGSQRSLQPWKPLCSQRATDHLGLSVFFQTSLLYKEKETRKMKKNKKGGNFSSDIKENKGLKPCMFGKRNTQTDIFMKCFTLSRKKREETKLKTKQTKAKNKTKQKKYHQKTQNHYLHCAGCRT